MLANDTPSPDKPVDKKRPRFQVIPSLIRMENLTPFTQPTPKTVSARIRNLRKSRGLTLHDIEKLSQGSVKAVVMGSYERGTRAISLARCLELANLFAIPVSELLSEPDALSQINQTSQTSQRGDSKRFDLRRSSDLASTKGDREFIGLYKFLIAIAQRRGDWNGEILTLRNTDLDTLTLLLEMRKNDLQSWLRKWQITLN
jgi:transcriptional regulator with XRE-family HTH domain